MIAQAERSNFLRQCWRQGHWKDGVGTLLMPLRMSIYELRRAFARARTENGHIALAAATSVLEPPAFSTTVRPIFCELGTNVADEVDLTTVFAEADAQIAGMYRLAGGRVDRLDSAPLESRRDPEDIHSYHRLYWVRRYAVAASYGHSGAKRALLTELPNWLTSGWENSKIATWPYTLAERIGSLAAALFWITRSGDTELSSLTLPMKKQIWKDAQRLSSSVEFGLGVHNHILNDARGLFLAGAALTSECHEADAWREQAWALWDEYFPQLVFADGTFAEQSSHYQLLLSRTALEYWLSCKRAGRRLPRSFEAPLRAMFDLANELVRPDGSFPRFGDISPDCTISDLWGLLAAANHYGLLTNALRHSLITPITLFYCGSKPNPARSDEVANERLFADGGFAFLRSAQLNAELVAHGDMRTCVGTHGDAGRGSYEIWWNGNLLVREPGSFLSGPTSNWQMYQSAESQNVTSLDGLPPAITKYEQKYAASWYQPDGGSWESLPDGGVRFCCKAFSRIHPDIELSRTWRFTRPDTLHFEEKIEGSRRVQFESRICLGDADWDQFDAKNPSASATLRWRGGDGSSAEMIINVPGPITIAQQSCSFLVEYGMEKAGRQLILHGFQQLPFFWTAQWKLRKAA